MTNTTSTTAPANAVTEDQAHRMLAGMGVSADLVAGAFHRLRTRSRTVATAGIWSYCFERLAADVFVVAKVPASSLR